MRNPLRVINTSSADRGLQHLLEIWPEVRKAVPEAQLEWFYGFQLFDQFYKNNPASMTWKSRMIELLGQPGVIKHGYLPQSQIKEEMETCGIFAYPSHFQEISCISSIKAQAYGCVPVVMNLAALKENVQFGIKVNGDIYDEEVKKIYTEQLIWALQHPEWQEEVRQPMQEWASKITWERVATQWVNDFEGKDNFAVIEPVADNKYLKVIGEYEG